MSGDALLRHWKRRNKKWIVRTEYPKTMVTDSLSGSSVVPGGQSS